MQWHRSPPGGCLTCNLSPQHACMPQSKVSATSSEPYRVCLFVSLQACHSELLAPQP